MAFCAASGEVLCIVFGGLCGVFGEVFGMWILALWDLVFADFSVNFGLEYCYFDFGAREERRKILKKWRGMG